MTITDSTKRAPLTDTELTEYQRLTALIEDIERRRIAIAQLHHGRRGSPVHLALLDVREQELYASGGALMRIRAPLYLRFKWPAGR